MNKFFISGLRKEANPATAGLAIGAHKIKPSVMQAADYSKPGQPAAWEKPLYAIQRGVAKLPVSVQKALDVAGGGVMGLPNPFGGIDNKPKSQKMFDPKDNPEQYHRDVYNMAKAREKKHVERHENNRQRLTRLFEEIENRPWRQVALAPYLTRAKQLYTQTILDPAYGSATSWRIGNPGSVEAMNFIDNIKYRYPSTRPFARKERF